MANFFNKRAHLVSDEDAEKHAEFVPYPTHVDPSQVDIDDDFDYDVEDLFNGKKKPSLAAGPDTVSHRHIVDLLPALRNALQTAIDKPLMEFQDITRNYIRLLDKNGSPHGKPFTEKSQRPISELNILPKYGSIKIFIDQLRNGMLNRLKQNQFAFPGKGGPMAIVTTLDTAICNVKKGKKVMVVFWDFSNAFCTTIHKVTEDIAKKFNLSERMMKLLSQFLEQTFSTIKMSDKDGFYLSEETHTQRGSPQGQIGSDFFFALVNDNIDPETIADEIIQRIKYVDDFTDVFIGDDAESLLKSLEHNEARLKRQATSVGLKLNDDKTKVICMNFADSELPTSLPNYENRFKTSWALLGFDFGVTRKRQDIAERLGTTSKHDHVNGDSAADAMINRLNGSTRLINTLRKVHGNIDLKVDAATKLVWSSCYDIGLVYAYASSKKFKSIEVCIRKLIRSAGLDTTMENNLVYQVSTKLPPEMMAKKQIIQLGVKFLDLKSVENNRYLVKVTAECNLRPFWNIFTSEFNKLPLELRKYIIMNSDPHDKQKMYKMKLKLRNFFRNNFMPKGVLSKEKRLKALKDNIYSRERVEKRKLDTESLARKRKFSTPTGMRQRLNSATFNRLAKLNRAPYREYRSFGPNDNSVDGPPNKKLRIPDFPGSEDSSIGAMRILGDTPKKRKRVNSSYSSMQNKRRKKTNPLIEVNPMHGTSKSIDKDRYFPGTVTTPVSSTDATRHGNRPLVSTQDHRVRTLRQRETICDSRVADVLNQQQQPHGTSTQRYYLRSTRSRLQIPRTQTPGHKNDRAGHTDKPD